MLTTLLIAAALAGQPPALTPTEVCVDLMRSQAAHRLLRAPRPTPWDPSYEDVMNARWAGFRSAMAVRARAAGLELGEVDAACRPIIISYLEGVREGLSNVRFVRETN